MIMEPLSDMGSVKLTSKIVWWTSDYALNRSFTPTPSPSNCTKVALHPRGLPIPPHQSAKTQLFTLPTYLGT